MTVLLGVDVGNSKTHVALATAAGDVLAVAAGRGANPQTLGPAGSWQVITALTETALARGGVDAAAVSGAAYAVAGLDFAFEEDAFAAATPALPWPRAISNDIFAVLRVGGRDGIAVVAGAGMNCVGRLGDEVVRFPALGALSGDWGGGFDLGLSALAAACRADDGRGRPTRLSELAPDHFGVSSVAAVVLGLHVGELDRAGLLGLGRAVLALADEGDTACSDLVHRQADEVVAFVDAAARRLSAPADLPAVLGGGLLLAGCDTLDTAIAAGLDRPVHRLPGPPVIGALQLAADHLGIAAPAPERLAGAVVAGLERG